MTDTNKTASVDSVAPDAAAMLPSFDLVDVLRGGTSAIRLAKQAYLPKFPLESDAGYDFRVKQSVLLPVYKETLARLVGRVFAKPLTLDESTPERIVTLCENVDGENRNLHVFARDVFEMALHYGVAHVLVDSAATTAMTAAEGAAKPYFVLVNPRRVIGWKFNSGVLSQLRLRDSVATDDGEFGTKTEDIITVLEPSLWRKFKQIDGVWSVFDEGVNSLGKIPMVSVYANRTGLMTASPPLLELAHLNIKHYQSQSDQDNILHTARVPLLLRTGANSDAKNIEVGSSVIDMEESGNLRYVEHSGAAIGAGRESLKDLLDEMQQCGAKLLQPNSSVKTATQAREDGAENKSVLAMMAENLRDSLDAALQLAAEWLNMPDGGKVNVNSDLAADSAPLETMTVINTMVAAGTLSAKTAFEEAKRRGILDDSRTWEDEQAQTQGVNQAATGAY